MDKAPSDPLSEDAADGMKIAVGTRFKDDEKNLAQAIAAAEKADSVTSGSGTDSPAHGGDPLSLFDTHDAQAEAEKLALGK